MSDQDTQVQDLRAELAEAKAANEALKEKAEKDAKAGYENQIVDLEAKIETQATEMEAVKSSLAEKTEAFDALTVAKTELEESAEAIKKEVEEMKKKEAIMKRKAQLEEVGFDAEEAVATVEDFSHLDDETFNKIVATMKGQSGKLPPWMKKDEEKDEDKKEEKEAKAESEETDSAEASEELLENVETPQETAVAQINSQPESEVDSLRASASEWIGSLLKSTK